MKEKNSKFKNLKFIKQSLGNLWINMLIIYAISGIIIYMNMGMTKFFGYTIDGVILKNESSLPHYIKYIFQYSDSIIIRLYIIIVMMCVLNNIIIAVSFFKSKLCSKFNLNLDRRVKKMLMEHLIKLKFKDYNNYERAEIIQRVNSDLSVYESIFTEKIPVVVDTLYTLIFAVTFTLNMNVILGLYIIISVVLLLILFFWYYKRTKSEIEKMMKYNIELIDSTNNIIENQEMIRVFDRNDLEQYKYDQTNLKFVKEINRFNWHKVFFEMFSNLVKALRQPVMYFIGGFLFVKGKIGIGELLVAISFADTVFNLFFSANLSFQNVGQIGLSYRELLKFMNKEEDQEDSRKEVKLDGDIIFKDVNIYIGEKAILKDINVTIKRNEPLVIFGDNGSGKTVFAKTILGFYNYTGDIFIGKYNIKDVNYNSIRKYIGLVLQDTYIFNDTIRNNIVLNNNDIDDKKINKVLEISVFDKDVNDLVNKLDTKIGDGSIDLSGGQRQRLSIARELIDNSKFVFFDDSLSKLDKNTREKLLANLDEISKEKTCVFITHDVNMLEKYKNVLFFFDEKIIKGTHEELLKTDEHYRHMIEIRKKAYIE